VILAVDPGMRKIGWALVEEGGRATGQGILALGGWEEELAGRIDLSGVKVVVVGNGTNTLNIEQALTRLCPQARLCVVDEAGSTVDAWQLKRGEQAGSNPFRQLWLWIDQLVNAANVDDYAARVLAKRWLDGREG
jgi:RNase H-fold protein (predicted Holliday junction resolvase)